jgi:serine/threonine protein kinase
VLVNEHGQALLTDFGLIAVGDGSTGQLSVPPGGTIQYMAPEFLFTAVEDSQDNEWTLGDTTGEPERQPLKTTEGDVFAYGRLILAVCLASCLLVGLNADLPVRSPLRKTHSALSRTK